MQLYTGLSWWKQSNNGLSSSAVKQICLAAERKVISFFSSFCCFVDDVVRSLLHICVLICTFERHTSAGNYACLSLPHRLQPSKAFLRRVLFHSLLKNKQKTLAIVLFSFVQADENQIGSWPKLRWLGLTSVDWVGFGWPDLLKNHVLIGWISVDLTSWKITFWLGGFRLTWLPEKSRFACGGGRKENLLMTTCTPCTRVHLPKSGLFSSGQLLGCIVIVFKPRTTSSSDALLRQLFRETCNGEGQNVTIFDKQITHRKGKKTKWQQRLAITPAWDKYELRDWWGWINERMISDWMSHSLPAQICFGFRYPSPHTPYSH